MLGVPVEHGPLDEHVRPAARAKLGDFAWFCSYPLCEAAYFNLFEAVVLVEELKAPVYPKDLNAPICACFGMGYDDVVADVHDDAPHRIRDVVAQSRTADARCHALAADGRPCIAALQELYLKLRSGR
jgi:hypothetical protein